MGPGFGEGIGEAIMTLIVLAFVIGVFLATVLIFGVPWVWSLLKPWLHTITG